MANSVANTTAIAPSASLNCSVIIRHIFAIATVEEVLALVKEGKVFEFTKLAGKNGKQDEAAIAYRGRLIFLLAFRRRSSWRGLMGKRGSRSTE